MIEYYQETYEEKGRKKQQAEECNTQDNNNRSRIDKKMMVSNMCLISGIV